MKFQDVLRKYPKFIYEKCEYEIVNDNLEIKYFFSIPPDHKFTHRIIIENCKLKIENLDNLVFHVGLSLMPSYWKLTCSPVIEITAGNLSVNQIKFWEKLFIKGMGEYFYQNQIDFTDNDFLQIIIGEQTEASQTSRAAGSRQRPGSEHKVLVPVGGGKDSIVTLELLKPHFKVIPFIINPVPIMLNVCQTAGLKPYRCKKPS